MPRPGEGASDELGFGPALRGDLDALAALDRGSPQAWNREAFAAELDRRPPTLFVLRCNGTVVGFAVARILGLELDIVNLAVDPERRRLGLGRFLLRSLLDHGAAAGVSSVFLEVREGNQAARSLYGSVGFKETQRRRAFYREPVEDAILMRLEMSHPQG